jgi:glutathione S-transferase
MALTLYSNPMSRGRIARWMLEEVGEPYEVVYVEYGEAMRTKAFLARNPMGKVPVLDHDGAVVTETAAICAYLADVFPAASLKASGPALAPYLRWLFFAAGPVEAAVSERSRDVSVSAEHEGSVGYGSYERTVDAMVTAAQPGPWICGEQFTAADVYFGGEVVFGLNFRTLPERPELVAYRDRLVTRPAYVRAEALDNEAMAQFS